MEVAKFPTAAAFRFLILALPPALALAPLRCHVNKIEVLSLSVIAAILLPTMLIGCGKKTQGGKEKTAQKSEDDFLDKDAKPDEGKYLLAAKPFFIAVANRKYADAYAQLSSHARARMSFNQFTPAEEQATFQQYESNPYMNVTAGQFAYLMQYVEAARGAPRAPDVGGNPVGHRADGEHGVHRAELLLAAPVQNVGLGRKHA